MEEYKPKMAHLQSSVFKLSKDLIDSIHVNSNAKFPHQNN